jgi:hypothetical protein
MACREPGNNPAAVQRGRADLIKGFFNLPWFLWAALASGLAVLWLFVGPHTEMTPSSGVRYLVIRWGHALTWLLLALGFFLRGVSPEWNRAADVLAVAGGLVYALFIVMTFVA